MLGVRGCKQGIKLALSTKEKDMEVHEMSVGNTNVQGQSQI